MSTRALTIIAALLVLLAGAFLYNLANSGPTQASTHNVIKITITKVPGVEATYRATDNFSNSAAPTTWHYQVITPSTTNCTTAWQDEQYSSAYTEANDVLVSVVAGNATICFRSSRTVPGTTYTTYKGITITDNVNPRVQDIFTYTSPKSFDNSNIGDVAVMRVEFVEKVNFDYNGGDGPRLKLNFGDDRYAYIEDGSVLRPRTTWTFHYTVQAEDYTDDLDVIAWEDNGADSFDEAANPFDATHEDNAPFFSGGYLADNYEVTIDTTAPVVSNLYTHVGPKVFDIDNIGDIVTIRVEFNKGVNFDYNGGDGPRLKFNFGDDRYIYIEEGTVLRSRTAWTFHYTVQAEDYTDDLDVIAWEDNGATALDEGEVSFSVGDSIGSFLNGYLADNYEVTIDTRTPPTVTTDHNSDDATAKREITITGSSSDTDVDDSTWQNKNIGGSATCDQDVFSISYNTGASFTLDNQAYNGNKVCFRVQDTSGSWGYGASGVITNIDRTKPTITVGAVTNDTVSATASDNQASSFALSFESVVITDTNCSSTTTGLATYGGTALTLATGSRACFKATDQAGNTRYVASGSNGDTTPPTVTVSPDIDDSAVKREITVTASSTDSDVVTSTWVYKVIAHDDTCNAAEMGSGTFSGRSKKLNNDATDNNVKVCFSVKDTSDNPQYAVSGVITGIDSTPPTITITPDPSSSEYSEPKQGITVQASGGDNQPFTNPAIWKNKLVSATTVCTPETMVMATGTNVGFLDQESQNNQRVCFSLEDNVGNIAYLASGVITNIDRTKPVIDVSSVSSTGVVTATVSDNQASSFTLSIKALGIDGTATCDSSITGFTAYTPGTTSLSLSVGQKACFKAEDAAGNLAYTASTTRTAPEQVVTDTTAPTITVAPASAEPSPKRWLRVIATSTDSDLDTSSWHNKLIAHDGSCDETQMSVGSYLGRSVFLNDSSQNNHKVCFGVKDTSNNWDYAVSGVITGIDNRAPRVTINFDEATNQVSAQVSDDQDSAPSFEYALINNGACDSDTSATFETYTAETVITLTAGSVACFKVTDTAGNVNYIASAGGRDTSPASLSVSDVINNQVRATLSGNLDNSPEVKVLVTTEATCDDSSGAFRDYTVGQLVSLAIGERACFKVTDSVANTNYQVSEVGVDPNQQPPLAINIQTRDTISARDNYPAGSTTMAYLITSGNTCNGSLTGFKAYQEGYVFTPTEATATRYVCFRSVESADATNVAYASAQLVASQTPPETPPVETPPVEPPVTSEIPNLSDDDEGSSLTLIVGISLILTTGVLIFASAKAKTSSRRD